MISSLLTVGALGEGLVRSHEAAAGVGTTVVALRLESGEEWTRERIRSREGSVEMLGNASGNI